MWLLYNIINTLNRVDSIKKKTLAFSLMRNEMEFTYKLHK